MHHCVNETIVPLHQRGGMGNDFWRVPVGLPNSPDYGEFGKLAGITTLTVSEAAGWLNCLKMGTLGERDFFVSS